MSDQQTIEMYPQADTSSEKPVSPQQHLAAGIRAISDSYHDLVYKPLENEKFKKVTTGAIKGYKEWQSQISSSGGNDPKLRSLFVNTEAKLPEKEQRHLETIHQNSTHDISRIMTGLGYALSDDKMDRDFASHLINPVIISWQEHVLERAARQVEGKPVLEKFNVIDQLEYLKKLFILKTYEGNEPDPRFHVRIIQETDDTEFFGDKLDLLAAIYNPARNSEEFLASFLKENNQNQGYLDFIIRKDPDDNLVIQVKDNAGGFPEDLLNEVEIRTKKGDKKRVPKALARSVTRSPTSKGSGFGLDIARSIFEDDIGATVSISNEIHPETNTLGAVFTATLT